VPPFTLAEAWLFTEVPVRGSAWVTVVVVVPSVARA
jgi:hypothetical protein